MREKNYNIEILRVVSCIMVIMVHVANFYCRAFNNISGEEYIFALTLNAISRVSVPCFLMITGYLMLDRNESVLKSLKRAIYFAVVLVVWSIIYYLFNTYYTHQKCDLKDILYTPLEGHLWYMYILIAIYIMLPFLQAMVRGMNEKAERWFAVIGGLWVIITYIAPFINVKIYYYLPILNRGGYIYYFYLGYYLKKYLYKFKISTVKSIIICISSLVLTVISVGIRSFENSKHIESLVYGHPLIVLYSALFFVLIMKYKDGKAEPKSKKILNAVSSCSFGIYLLHIVFLDIYKINIEADRYSAFIMLPLLTISIGIITFFCVFLWNKSINLIKIIKKEG